jgi:hypothetical protein
VRSEVIATDKSFEIVTKDWEKAAGSCCFSGRVIVFLRATDSGDQASLDCMENGLSHFNPDQIRRCSPASCVIVDAVNILFVFLLYLFVPQKLIPITTEDVKVIKKMRMGYGGNDKAMKRTSARITEKSSLFWLERGTATWEDFMAVARRDGKMDPIARNIGNWAIQRTISSSLVLIELNH